MTCCLCQINKDDACSEGTKKYLKNNQTGQTFGYVEVFSRDKNISTQKTKSVLIGWRYFFEGESIDR